MNPDDDTKPSETSGEPPRYLQIDTAIKRRWVGSIAYVLFFLVVAGGFGFLLARFTQSKLLAALLVGFMVLYMGIQGWLASRSLERTRRDGM